MFLKRKYVWGFLNYFVVVEKWNIEAEINNSSWFQMLSRNWNVKYWNMQYWKRNNFFLFLNNALLLNRNWNVQYWNGNNFFWFQILYRCYIIIEKWNIETEITFLWFQMLHRCWKIETEITFFLGFKCCVVVEKRN